MRTYDLDSNTQFIWSEARGLISVSTLDDINNPTIKDANWKHRVACIGPGEIYNSLSIFGTKVHGTALKKLSVKIGDAFVLVNREGYCLLSTHAITGPSFCSHFFRLNDLFDWSEYGVKPVFRTVWSRTGLENGNVILDVDRGSRIFYECIDVVAKDENHEGGTDVEDDDDPGYDVNQVVDERQMEIPSERFRMVADQRQQFFAKLEESIELPEFTPLDEHVGRSFPGTVVIHTLDGVFDTENWWAIRVKLGKDKCIVGYYGGCHTRVRMDTGEAYFLPYNQGQTLTSSTQFFLARMRNTGITCVAFKYNPEEGSKAVQGKESIEKASKVEADRTNDDDDYEEDDDSDDDDDDDLVRFIR
ncbi:hypothetical protein vseg_007173 [Gypsophila vaccaria]